MALGSPGKGVFITQDRANRKLGSFREIDAPH
jgi:hypothetical protein